MAAHDEVLLLMEAEATNAGSEDRSAAMGAVARIVMNLDEFVTRD
jgi:hypothetical protein